MSDWVSLPLSDVADLIRNQIKPSEMSDELYIGLEHIGQGTLNLINVGSSLEVASNKFRFREGDVLYGKLRPYFRKIIYAKFGGLCSTDIWVLRAKEGIDSRFLFYMTADPSFTEMANRSSEGTKMPRANWDYVSSQSFLIPPINEQRAIAHVLGTLDDKIELNRRMNETLEAIARAIFKSWFIDFDPVRAKMEGRKPFGMDDETAALFPDSFEESEMGEIPKGWLTLPLDHIADFKNGLALQNYPPDERGFLPVIKIAELSRGITDSSDKASIDLPGDCVINDGDIIFSWSGTLDVIIWAGGKGALNQHLFKVTSKDYPKWFYYQWIRQYLSTFREIASEKATTMGHIQRHHISEALVLVPPNNLLKRMDAIIEPMMSSILNNALEARTLSSIRDMLVPKLISGEIRLREFRDDGGE